MDEEKKTIENGEKVEPKSSDYLDAIKVLKQREEDLSKENKQLKEDNSKMLNDFLNGGIPSSVPKKVERAAKEIAEEMRTKKLNNLDFIEDALEYRDAVMKEGYPDPFVGYGVKKQTTQADIEAAERVARVFRETIDNADGDSALFTSKLQSEIRG